MEATKKLNLQGDYKDKGLMPGFFSWLKNLNIPIDAVNNLAIEVEVVDAGADEEGYVITRATGESTIFVQLKDGTEKHKTFTKQELHGGHK